MKVARFFKSNFFAEIPLFLVLSISVIGVDVAGLALFLIVIYLGFNREKIRVPSKGEFLFLLLLGQYLILHLIKVSFFEGGTQELNILPAASGQMWLWSIAGLSLMFLYSVTFDNLEASFHRLVPWIVLVGFIGLGVDYFSSNLCRVKFLNWDVFATPLMTSGLALFWIGIADFGKTSQRIVGIVLVSAILISSIAFAGTRGVLIAQIAVLLILLVYCLISRENMLLFVIVTGLGLGLTSGYAIDYFANCNFSTRTTIVSFSDVGSLSDLAESAAVKDKATSARFEIWARVVPLIGKAPLLGHGVSFEPVAAGPGRPHAHNIYLSWMIWGGVVSLVSGLSFLFALLISRSQFIFERKNFFAFASISLLWALVMVFDSFLVWGHHHHTFLLFSVIAFFVSKQGQGVTENGQLVDFKNDSSSRE